MGTSLLSVGVMEAVMTAISVVLAITSVAIVSLFALESCGEPSRAARPAAYGAELAACEHASKTWAEYVPCCQDAARRSGRPPTACADGGTP